MEEGKMSVTITGNAPLREQQAYVDYLEKKYNRKLKTLDEQSDTDMIFAKMPTETEISKNGDLNICPSPIRVFLE